MAQITDNGNFIKVTPASGQSGYFPKGSLVFQASKDNPTTHFFIYKSTERKMPIYGMSFAELTDPATPADMDALMTAVDFAGGDGSLLLQ